MLADLTPVTAIAAMPEDKRTPAQADKIRDYFLEHALPARIAEAWHTADRRAGSDEMRSIKAFRPSWSWRKCRRRARRTCLIRGMYDRPGEVVTPGCRRRWRRPRTRIRPNRLGLAQWLVDPSNPLMARVTVNRFWQMYFGTGIVKTAEDFGSQGEPPSHPELLDWLATEFVRTGWDVKALQKTIVMSATYRQASRQSSGPAGEGSRQPAARTRAEPAALGRHRARSGAGDCRPAGEQGRRALGEAVSAGGSVE